MTIAQGYRGCNSTVGTSNHLNFGIGNLIPHWWHHKILSCGKPDLISMTVLSELVFLYYRNDGREFNEGYAYLERKFNLTRHQLQAATLRLSEMGIVTRTFRAIVINGRTFPNELHLKLNVDVLLALMPSNINRNDSNNSDNFSQNLSLNEEEKFFCEQVLDNSDAQSLKISDKHISNRNISLKSRSNESSFENKSLSGFFSQAGKTLFEFHPIGAEDLKMLQTESNRAFDLNFCNQLILRLANRFPNHCFPNEAAFFSYMAKSLKYELRNEVLVNNASFRFKNSEDANSNNEYKKDKYLQTIENSNDTTLASRLRRKISGVFGTDIAYSLLVNTSFFINKNDKTRFLFKSHDPIKLSDHQKESLLKEVRSVYGNDIESINFLSSVRANKQSISKINDNDYIIEPNLDDGIWSKVRHSLREFYGEAMDKHWFSKLTPIIKVNEKTISLKAPTNFMKDWINQNYRLLIEKSCLTQNFRLIEVTT